jgi:hypothetical protein
MKRTTTKDQISVRRKGVGPALALAVTVVFGTTALAGVGYLLWPRWPQAEIVAGAPTLPITVCGTLFNVPPAAIRFPPQRQAGAQARLDLAFQWPQLTPPEPDPKPTPSANPQPLAQLFISIAAPQGSLPINERLRTIYPRYLAAAAFPGPTGLSGVAFRDGTPYQGEDLLFDADRPERFLVRCTREGQATPGTCLLERQVGATELTVRFPRHWLDTWPALGDSVDQLIERLAVGS